MIDNLVLFDVIPSVTTPLKGDASLKSGIAGSSPEKQKEVVSDFEAMFINSMLKAMRKTVGKDDIFHSRSEELYTSLLDQELSRVVASRGIGLSEILLKELKVFYPSTDK